MVKKDTCFNQRGGVGNIEDIIHRLWRHNYFIQNWNLLSFKITERIISSIEKISYF